MAERRPWAPPAAVARPWARVWSREKNAARDGAALHPARPLLERVEPRAHVFRQLAALTSTRDELCTQRARTNGLRCFRETLDVRRDVWKPFASELLARRDGVAKRALERRCARLLVGSDELEQRGLRPIDEVSILAVLRMLAIVIDHFFAAST